MSKSSSHVEEEVVVNGSKPRAAVFLDFENLCNNQTDHRLASLLSELASRATIVSLLGCTNAKERRRLAFRFPQVRIFTHGGGPDAADHRLLDMIQTQLPRSIDMVILGSGDGIFTSQAQELRKCGLRVEVIARAGPISGRLYRAVDDVHLIDVPLPVSA
jgi:hypothetical protein